MSAMWSRLLLASMVLVACAREPVKPCERLGALCEPQELVQRFDGPRWSSASADLDGDGETDLVVAEPELGLTIAWGSGPWRDLRLYRGGAADVGLADLEGDGDMDILFVTVDPPQLHALENTGSHEFPEVRVLDVEGRPESLWVGALDGDASPDAVVATSIRGGLTIFTAGLERRERLDVGDDLVAVEVADLEGDGGLDIVAADYAGSALFVVPAHDASAAAPVRSPAGPAPEYLQLADFDGDGRLDALTHGRAGPQIWLHTGTGAGSFAQPRALDVLAAPSPGFTVHGDERGARWIVAAADGRVIATEVDASGRAVRRVMNGLFAEIASAGPDGDGVLGRGESGFTRYGFASAPMFTEVGHVADRVETSREPVLGDFVRDGVPDVAAFSGDGVVSIYAGRPDGRWEEHSTLEVSRHALWLEAGDVTGDGRLDLVVGISTPELQIAVGRDDGTFELAPPVPTTFSAWSLHTFQPFGTGAAAVAVASGHGGEQGVEIFTFAPAGNGVGRTTPITAGSATRLASADLDADGREELVAFVHDGPDFSLVILTAEGDGWGPVKTRSLAELEPMLEYELSVESGFGLGDLDRDGTVDAVIVVRDAIVTLPDFAADTPPAPRIDTAYGVWGAEHVGVAHADDDGRLDVVIHDTSGFYVALGSDGGELRLQTPFDEFAYAGTLVVDPVDRRATAAYVSERGVSVLAPEVAPTLRRDKFFSGAGPAARVATGDIDADGRTDVVVTEEPRDYSGGFSVLWGGDGGAARPGAGVSAGAIHAVSTAELDGRPGAEIVLAHNGRVSVWTFADGSFEMLGNKSAEVYQPREVDVLARAGGPADVVVLGVRSDGVTLRLVALPRASSDDFTAWEPEVVLWEGAVGSTPPTMAVADFDGDDFSDVAVLPGRGQPVQVVWGDAGRSAQVTTPAVGAADVRTLAAGDVDGDARPDLVVGAVGGTMKIGFTRRIPSEAQRIAEPCTEFHVALADFEGDGVPDVLCGEVLRTWIELRPSSGRVEQALMRSPKAMMSSMRAVELDGDGILDLVDARDGALVTRLSAGGGR